MKKLMIAALAMVAFGAMDVSAQNASVTIPEVLMITSSGQLTIADTEFDFSAANTSAATGAVTVNTRANVAHAIEVSGSALVLGTDNLNLEVQGSDASWTALSGTAVRAVAGLTRGSQSGTVNFRTTADVALHAPGEYTGSITYTVVAN